MTAAPADRRFDPIDIVRASVRYVADLVEKIVNGIRAIAPIGLMLGCESAYVQPQPPPPAPNASELVSRLEQEPSNEPGPLGQFTFTFYYMIGEEEVVAPGTPANSNEPELATVAPEDLVTLYEPDKCEP